MYGARRPAEPLDAQDKAVSQYLGNFGQIRLCRSGVANDYNREFANSFALFNALDAAGCSVGSSAEEILARPAFTVGTRKTSVELFAVSAAELGFQSDTVRLSDIYARAQQLGFGLAAAEVAPQLRLQFLDQSMGEFLVAIEPIKTWAGEPVILSVANGGAGLVLIGRDGSANAEIPVATRFLFVRSEEAALAQAARGVDDVTTHDRR